MSLQVNNHARAIKTSSVLLQDENRVAVAAKAGVKKGLAKRTVLSDISNVTAKAKATVKAEQKPGLGRVPIFAKPPAASNPSASITDIVPAVSLTSLAPSISSAVVPAKPQHHHHAVVSVPTRSEGIIRPVPVHQVSLPTFESIADTCAGGGGGGGGGSGGPMEIDEDEDKEVEDIDVNDQHDPQCCTEYVQDIFEYCREKETKDAVSASYMSRQVDINEKMRGILVDWLVEVHVKFRFLTETMFLSVGIIDRFLAQKPVARQKLQLVGITAMFIASKYEEIYAPELRDFIVISADAYTRDEVLKMERLILSTLDFNLSTPTPLHFLRRFSKAARSDSRTHTLSKYLTELTLAEFKMIEFVPSLIAAASVYIARRMTDKTPHWTPTLEKYTTYSEEQLRDCALTLNAIVKRTEKPGALKAVRKKYLNPKLLEVAKIPSVDF